LNQRDPAAAARNLRYHDYFLQARLRKIQEYQSTVAQLSQTEQDLQQALADLREQRNQLAQQQGLLQAQYDERRRALQNLRGQVRSKGDVLSRLQLDRNTLSTKTMGAWPAPCSPTYLPIGLFHSGLPSTS